MQWAKIDLLRLKFEIDYNNDSPAFRSSSSKGKAMCTVSPWPCMPWPWATNTNTPWSWFIHTRNTKQTCTATEKLNVCISVCVCVCLPGWARQNVWGRRWASSARWRWEPRRGHDPRRWSTTCRKPEQIKAIEWVNITKSRDCVAHRITRSGLNSAWQKKKHLTKIRWRIWG